MMMDDNNFITISSLIGEPARASMLWSLLDGRAYTASELSHVANISATSASNHLTKLLEADLLKVEVQGRHRYFSFSRPEVAYVIESLANLSEPSQKSKSEFVAPAGIRFCRTCYDHLAGFTGVKITEALESKKLIRKFEKNYAVTRKGWIWLNDFKINEHELADSRRPIARQCLDWTERRPHLAGQLGALLLDRMTERKWFRKIQFSREMIVTPRGKEEIAGLLGVRF